MELRIGEVDKGGGRKRRSIATEIRQKNKHKISQGLTRKNTEESRSRRISHGRTRKNTEGRRKKKAEAED